MRMHQKLLLMLCVEYNFSTSGLPSVCLTLFACLCVSGGDLEPFMRVLLSGSLLLLKREMKGRGMLVSQF